MCVLAQVGTDDRGVPSPASTRCPMCTSPPPPARAGEPWWEPRLSSLKYAWQRVLIPASNICSELCGGPNGRRRHFAQAGHTSIIAFQISDTVTRVIAAFGPNPWKCYASFMKDSHALFAEKVTNTFSVQVKSPVW